MSAGVVSEQFIGNLCEADWGDWSPTAVQAAVARISDWQAPEFTGGWLGVSTPSGRLDFQTGKYGYEGERFQWAEFDLPKDLREPAEFGDLVQRLAQLGNPVPHRSTGAVSGLRWTRDDHTVLLQRNTSRAWIEVRPTAPGADLLAAEALAHIRRLASVLHDLGPAPWTAAQLELEAGESISRVLLLEHPAAATLLARRELFAAVLDAVAGVIGGPTLYGGSAESHDVRWRNDIRTLTLRGDNREIWFESHGTEELDAEEARAFEWGGAWSESEPHDFDFLPYLWQLDRQGPGDNPDFYPGGRLAAALTHWQDALTLLFAALLEQLPAQLGAEWLGFKINNTEDFDRMIMVSVDDKGLVVQVDDRDGDDSEAAAELMRARGWQRRERHWWRAEFTEPTSAAAAAAARVIVADVHARGARLPDQLGATDISCADNGYLRLTGLGIGR